MPVKGRIVLCLALFSLCLWQGNAYAYSRERWLKRDQVWAPEFQIDTQFLGHIGTATVQNGPRTGFILQGEFAVWWHHALRFDLHGGRSLSGDPAWTLGAGLKINLLELGVRSRDGYFGGQRGILGSGHQNILIHLDGGVTRFWFSTLNPASTSAYPLGQWAFYYGAGIQWGLGYDIVGVDRLFIESTVNFARMNSIFYALPHIAIGFNF